MMRIQSKVTLLAVASASAALMLSCQKGGGAGGGAVTGAAKSAMDVLPKDTSLVFGFSLKKFHDTSFYPMLTGAIPKAGQDQLKQVKDTCGIDALNDIESVIIGADSGFDKNKALILVSGKWDEGKVSKCATELGPKLGKKVTTAKDGNITAYTVDGKHTAYVGWLGGTMVISPPALNGDKTYLATVLQKKSSISDNKVLMDLVKKCDTSATMWGAVEPGASGEVASTLQRMTGGSEKVAGLWLTLRLSKTLDADAGMRLSTPAEADAVAKRATAGLEEEKKDPNMGQYLKNAKVAKSGADVTVKVTLDEKQMQALTEMAKQAAPMLQMMMGGGG